MRAMGITPILKVSDMVSGGVASLHTGETLDHIATLRQKHGIDSDTHASYRFVEG